MPVLCEITKFQERHEFQCIGVIWYINVKAKVFSDAGGINNGFVPEGGKFSQKLCEGHFF